MDGSMAFRLRDIHLPEPVSWWPPAPGWWALLALSILSFLALRYIYKIKRRRRIRVAALVAFKKLSNGFAQQPDTNRLAKDLSILLRRICLSYFPRAEVAGLTGEKWLLFLETSLGRGKSHLLFSEGIGRALITSPYQPNAELDGERLLNLCGNWIRELPLLGSKG